MSPGHARMTWDVTLRRVDLDERQAVIECRIGLSRILDKFDGPVPDCSDRSSIPDSDELREAQSLPTVPAFGNHLRPDPGGVAERDGKRGLQGARHQPPPLAKITDQRNSITASRLRSRR